jgi:hypothetical protein
VSWVPQEAGSLNFQARDIFLVPIDTGMLSIASDDEPAKDMPLAGGQVLFLPGAIVAELSRRPEHCVRRLSS